MERPIHEPASRRQTNATMRSMGMIGGAMSSALPPTFSQRAMFWRMPTSPPSPDGSKTNEPIVRGWRGASLRILIASPSR
jgi:hypothetical protein